MPKAKTKRTIIRIEKIIVKSKKLFNGYKFADYFCSWVSAGAKVLILHGFGKEMGDYFAKSIKIRRLRSEQLMEKC